MCRKRLLVPHLRTKEPLNAASIEWCRPKGCDTHDPWVFEVAHCAVIKAVAADALKGCNRCRHYVHKQPICDIQTEQKPAGLLWHALSKQTRAFFKSMLLLLDDLLPPKYANLHLLPQLQQALCASSLADLQGLSTARHLPCYLIVWNARPGHSMSPIATSDCWSHLTIRRSFEAAVACSSGAH